jgi:hypothetical protein
MITYKALIAGYNKIPNRESVNFRACITRKNGIIPLLNHKVNTTNKLITLLGAHLFFESGYAARIEKPKLSIVPATV